MAGEIERLKDDLTTTTPGCCEDDIRVVLDLLERAVAMVLEYRELLADVDVDNGSWGEAAGLVIDFERAKGAEPKRPVVSQADDPIVIPKGFAITYTHADGANGWCLGPIAWSWFTGKNLVSYRISRNPPTDDQEKDR